MKYKIALIVIIAALLRVSAFAQTSEFPYQGQLQASSAAANGSFDFEFALFDSQAGGAQLGVTLVRSGVAVANGIFSVSLDFGNQFPGANRFLEIRVRQSGAGAFTTLSPRQPVNSSPYSVKSLASTTADTAATALNANNAATAGTFTGNLAGDVTGTQVATTVARLRGRNVSSNQPNNGQVLKFNTATSQWEPATDETGSGGGGGTITGVTAGTGLTGGGTTGGVTVGIANSGVNTPQLADSGVTDAKITSVSGAKVTGPVASATTATNFTGPLAGAITGTQNATAIAPNVVGNANILNGAITDAKIAAGQVVLGINGLRDNLTLAAGSNVTITPSGGNTLTIASSGGSVNAILNQTTPQAGANFNIAGTGTANVFSAESHYSISGLRVLGTPGLNTVVVGTSAGAVNTGSGNAFFGFSAGATNTTGDSNAFFGARAGEDNSIGIQNAFFGTGAGASNISGSANAFFGQIAGAGNTTGQGNSFFGGAAGASNTTAFNNSFFGREAGRNNTAGERNSFLGYRAGFSMSSGNNNTFVGVDAGFANTVGSENTALGGLAGFNAVNLTNATAIGARAYVSANNSLVLGSISGINGATADTNVGIGTTVPGRLLHILGDGSNGLGTGDLIVEAQGNVGSAVTLRSFAGTGGRTYSWLSTGTGADSGPGRLALFDATAGGYRMVVDSSGRVGIGTTAPDALLSVNGTANKPGGGSWATFSDERLKNVKGKFTAGLHALKGLQPIRFEYKSDNKLGLKGEGEYVGFSAQDVKKVLPEAISTSTGGYLQLNADPILWTMLNAIKEQQAAIESLEKRLRILEKKRKKTER